MSTDPAGDNRLGQIRCRHDKPRRYGWAVEHVGEVDQSKRDAQWSVRSRENKEWLVLVAQARLCTEYVPWQPHGQRFTRHSSEIGAGAAGVPRSCLASRRRCYRSLRFALDCCWLFVLPPAFCPRIERWRRAVLLMWVGMPRAQHGEHPHDSMTQCNFNSLMPYTLE